jgi:hypothetical protein
MMVGKVHFTGLELTPDDVADRWHRGVIPAEWKRVRFTLPRFANYPISTINRWLFSNITGRWSIYLRPEQNFGSTREVVIAFEHAYDAVTFVMADGKTESCEGSTDRFS